jgi:hypothetical protein
MIHVTTDAKMELHDLLLRLLAEQPAELAERFSLRLTCRQGDDQHWGLLLDEPSLGDDVVEHEGRPVLLVDADTREIVSDRTLEVTATPAGTQFALRR